MSAGLPLQSFVESLCSVLVVNESVIVLGFHKAALRIRIAIDLLAVSLQHILIDLLQDDVNDNLAGKLFRLKYFLACWCRCQNRSLEDVRTIRL